MSESSTTRSYVSIEIFRTTSKDTPGSVPSSSASSGCGGREHVVDDPVQFDPDRVELVLGAAGPRFVAGVEQLGVGCRDVMGQIGANHLQWPVHATLPDPVRAAQQRGPFGHVEGRRQVNGALPSEPYSSRGSSVRLVSA
jgi:hypothetical protein